MDTHALGIIVGGIIPAFVFGGFGVMQKQCMRAGLRIGAFFIVLGVTVAGCGLGVQALVPGGIPTLKAAFFAVGYALLWSLGIGLILLAVSRFRASISQLVPLYNSATLVTVIVSLWLLAEWKEVGVVPLLFGAAAIVGGAVLGTFATREAVHEPDAESISPLRRRRRALLVGGLLPALVLGFTGPLMKSSIRAGMGTGEFLVLFGATLTVVGVASQAVTGGGKPSPAAVMMGMVTGVLWSTGTGMTLTALGVMGASISQLNPLYNMNTLVVVLLGLWIFKEHRDVRPLPLVLGAALTVAGAALVAGA